MTIIINKFVIYYWIIAIVFETIYTYVGITTALKELKKQSESYVVVMQIFDYLKQLASAQFIFKQVFNIQGYFIGYLILCILSPILLPFSLIRLFKKLIGYKTELQKKAEAESKAMKEDSDKAKEWMKSEGVGG